jgi:hypothetical protein
MAIEGVGGIGSMGGIGGGKKTCGPGGIGIGGCGRIPIASMQLAGNGIDAGITMMMAVCFASLLRNGQQSHSAFAALVLSLAQLHFLAQQQSPSLQQAHLLSLQQLHFASHFPLLQQQSPSLLHFPSLQHLFVAQAPMTVVCAQTAFPVRATIAAISAACPYLTNVISFASFSPKSSRHLNRGETIAKEAGPVSSNQSSFALSNSIDPGRATAY